MIGGSVQLTAIFRDNQQHVVNQASAAWVSKSPTIASVSPSGFVTGLQAGAATIEASGSGLVATAIVTVVPPAKPLTFQSGRGFSDTVMSGINHAVVLKTVDATGNPRSRVAFSLSIPSAPFGQPASFVPVQTTDDQGTVTVQLKTGTLAGTFTLVATETVNTNSTDTLSFTVLAGAAAKISAAPKDSGAYVGNGYSLRAPVLDRFNNVTTGTLTWAVDSGATSVTVAANGQLTATSIGRARIVARMANTSVTDTARISVVPPGKLVGTNNNYEIVVMNMDGSGLRTLVKDDGNSYPFPSWSPDGQYVVYNSSVGAGRLFRVDMAGKIVPLSPTVGAMPSETWPRYSYDGQWLFFTGGYYPDSLDTYRMKADGSGPRVRVTPPRPYSTRYWKASPSPDGSSLAYTDATDNLILVDLQTGKPRTVYVGGAESPRFSPQGDWIAFSDEWNYQLHIVRPDGTQHRFLTPVVGNQRVFPWGHDWSPDGQWIIYYGGQELRIVRVSDGLSLPLIYSASGGALGLSWHQ